MEMEVERGEWRREESKKEQNMLYRELDGVGERNGQSGVEKDLANLLGKRRMDQKREKRNQGRETWRSEGLSRGDLTGMRKLEKRMEQERKGKAEQRRGWSREEKDGLEERRMEQEREIDQREEEDGVGEATAR